MDALKENLKKADELGDLLLPPNATLLYSLYDEYCELAKSQKLESSQYYKTLKNKVDKLLVDNYSRKNLFNDNSSTRSASITYNQKQFLMAEIDDEMKVSIPAKCFLFADEQFSPNTDKLSLILDNFNYPISTYTYKVERNGKSLDDVNIVFTVIIPNTIDTGGALKKNTYPKVSCSFDSDSMQDKTPIPASVDKPAAMLKTFKFSEIPEPKPEKESDNFFTNTWNNITNIFH